MQSIVASGVCLSCCPNFKFQNGSKTSTQYEEAQELQERPSYMSTLHYNRHKMGRVNSMWNPMNSHEFM